jgi:16S rRNA (cytidine1402-2'-O)-methyltransferase
MAKLYLIPTPIGNLEDITFRAVRLLKEADLILAEDTRTTAILLKHYNIFTPLQSHHQHNEHQTITIIARKISDGQNIALVSDAGTPGISDPGFLLIRECLKQGIEIECLPGATAFVPALVNSGIPCDRFYFEGFLPVKKGRQSRLKELSELSHTIIFYESPFRLLKTLEQLIVCFGEDRKASVSRELTKIHEENVRGNLKELFLYFSTHIIKGEIVIILEGKQL